MIAYKNGNIMDSKGLRPFSEVWSGAQVFGAVRLGKANNDSGSKDVYK
jgi:hypothetical protein